ncbi:Cell surface glycoprotein [Wickerhamomyces ciferrii]|uniref:Cell surface glycoprotein n=1 Tax=Wickerhamomyces ciferrii (strain ATCC 14091 / BCRC 22168 / CBS 111 / JCM 3599 / NBRC 0793 / NRRL Y-1031 F-60-10) TaxID=1206466 RepID=K0KKF1_WICCF|nr:Cell surface glycoprotein [Wickerhamomyces ciferrii]CCH41949.1 Cell surface glycoprotein [Wickerhamomyces ciferrii]
MTKFIPNGQVSGNHLSKLETTAEKSIGKEINLVNGKDFNHLDLVIEAKNNRLKSEFFYIYDYEKFNNCSLLKENFDVLSSGQITHNSSRYVIHYLTMELKKRLKEIRSNVNATKQELNMIYDVFKPSLGQFDDKDIIDANDFIRSLFPYEGCSFTGEKLEKLIAQSNWITLILSLRIVWSLLPNAILPWKSFHKFNESEKRSNFTNKQSFYQVLPTFLPSHNHACVLFEFLEVLLYIFSDNYFLDLNHSVDLIFTAGQICFNRDEFKPSKSQNDDDLNELQSFYYKRGYSFYQIFISYLRSLAEEASFNDKVLLETFKIHEYPPSPYKPVTQKALTLTVPADEDLEETNYFKLISNASNATSRIYSSNHTFTKFENKFLDKFEINPHKIIEHFFSKSSKNYLLKFDKNLNFENFKVGNDINEFRKNLKNGTLFENKELISTFINDFSRYGFEGNNNAANQNESFVADTINFNFNSKMENVDNNPVRVSKLEISEWFINAWKYETFLGYLQNTVILKLTKTIGDCDWLIITSNEKVSANNRYLTPPSSAETAIDNQKEKELSQFGQRNSDDSQAPIQSSNNSSITSPNLPKKELLPALSTRRMKSPKNGEYKTQSSIPPTRSPQKKKSPKKNALKNISHPSPPRDISHFEKQNPDNFEGSGSPNAMKSPLPIMKDLPKPKNFESPVKQQSIDGQTLPDNELKSPMAEIIDVHADAQSQDSDLSESYYDDDYYSNSNNNDQFPLQAPGKLNEGDATPGTNATPLTNASSSTINSPSPSATSYASAKSSKEDIVSPKPIDKDLPEIKASNASNASSSSAPVPSIAVRASVASGPPVAQTIEHPIKPQAPKPLQQQQAPLATPLDQTFFPPPSGIKNDKLSSTPPQQLSKNNVNPPPIFKDSHNTDSLNSNTSKAMLSQLDLNKPTGPYPRSFNSPNGFGQPLPKSPVGSPARFNTGPVVQGGALRSPKPHPYQQFQHQSPQKQSNTFRNSSAPAPQQLQPPRGPGVPKNYVPNSPGSRSSSAPNQLPPPPSNGISNAPRQQFATPPNKPIDKFPSMPSPQFNFTKPLSQPSSPNSITPNNNSNEALNQSNGKSRRFSKLAVATKDVQSQIKQFSQSNSPIGQAFPKFFKKASSENLKGISNSTSSNSLAHINDGSGPDKKTGSLLINNPELEIRNIDSIPEIPYTPRALRDQASSNGSDLESNRQGSSSSLNSNSKNQNEDLKKEIEDDSNSDFNKLINQNRQSFTGETSSANISSYSNSNSNKSLPDLIESNEGEVEGDSTVQSKNDHLKIEQNLDGLLEEIKESLGSEESEKFFSTDDLSTTKPQINSN